jgi:hypothetical protein
MAPIIQLGLDPQDDRLWWCDMHRWQTQTEDGEEEPNTVMRPTEIRAFRNIFRQSRLMAKKGVMINLTPLHREALRLEHQAMSKPPYPDNVYGFISSRMPGVPPTQVKFLLDECSLVVLLRDVLGMPALVMDWELPVVVKRAA